MVKLEKTEQMTGQQPVRNKIDLTLPPDVLFLNPWRDPGFRMLGEPEFIWRPLPNARIEGFAASAHPEVNDKIKQVLQTARRAKRFRQPVEYNSVPVILEKASFRKSFVMARDRVLLSGASGTRAVNRYRRDNNDAGVDADARLEDYFETCRENNAGKEVPIYSGLLEPDIPFVVECRNTFNYFHFITESLCQLTMLDGLGFQGNIFFHFPNQEDKQQPFAKAFVDALFPEYEGRVFFERAPKDYSRVLTAYDLIGGHYQAPIDDLAGMNDLLPEPIAENGGATSLELRVSLNMNTVNSSLIALRQRAHRAIEGGNFDHLPKRFFVGRDTRFSRERHLEGEELLFDHLALFGFEYVVFENLSPLEQIALMARAEMMVSYHGAGFTNMLFAGPQTYAIEIGTLQTAQIRWGDFWPLALASGCKYINFFGDFKAEDPLSEPDFEADGIVPASLSKAAIAQIVGLIVTLFGQYPDLKRPRALAQLASEVLQVGGAEHAVGLLEKHSAMLPTSGRLCLIKADCHKELDEPKSELVALDMAHKADPGRWQTLVRMIWCAKRCDRPQVIRWALARLKIDFPQRHDNFLNNHEWVRYVA
ncbi:Capsular polysaccharide biosynthesis protein [Sulfitobacter noctilucae]|uniref:glycosyltransferase 61 family protein n=1 Tax=Sulfitobacter noctilucae TaxID=1342302 RepID=UPI000468382E|nr:glycosyltransferase family 61 protein [Sulfitobacter noctilucae]KIN65736.1 Capsular polysaccharide biosynthesis protein [Sulfitobacter noctilucae]